MDVDRKSRSTFCPDRSGASNPQSSQAGSSLATRRPDHSVSGPSLSSSTRAPVMPDALQRVAADMTLSLPQDASGWQDVPLPVFRPAHKDERLSAWCESGDPEMSDATPRPGDGKLDGHDKSSAWPASIGRAYGELSPALAALQAELAKAHAQLTREAGFSTVERTALAKALDALDLAGKTFGDAIKDCAASGVQQVDGSESGSTGGAKSGSTGGSTGLGHSGEATQSSAALRKLFEPCRKRDFALTDASARFRKAIPAPDFYKFDARTMLVERWVTLELQLWMKVRGVQTGLLRLRALIDHEEMLARSCQADWPGRQDFQGLRRMGCGLAGPGYAVSGLPDRTPEPFYAQVLTMKAVSPSLIEAAYGHFIVAAAAERMALSDQGAGNAGDQGDQCDDGDFEMSSAQAGRSEVGQDENKGSTHDTRSAEAAQLISVAAMSMRDLALDPVALVDLQSRLHLEHMEQSLEVLTGIVGAFVTAQVPWKAWCDKAMAFIAGLESSRRALCAAALKIGSLQVLPHHGRGGYALGPASAARIAVYANAVRDHQAVLRKIAVCLHQGRLECLDVCERMDRATRLRLKQVLKFHDDCLADVYSELNWIEREILQLPPQIMMPDRGTVFHRHGLRRKDAKDATGAGSDMLH